MSLSKYLKEMEYTRFYILALLIPVTLFYSIYFFLDAGTITFLTDEDHFFEWLTVVFFLGASLVSLKLFLKSGNLFYVLFFVAFFFAAGEEISWGQRLLGIEVPEAIREKNVQQELTLHNLEVFNTIDLNGQPKQGLIRLLEINFLFRLGTLGYGILLPLLVFHFGIIQKITQRLKLPVPPVSIGIFFLINWMVFRSLHTTMPSYSGGGDEIFETLGAFILLIICIFFYKERNRLDYIGTDMKESLKEEPEAGMVTSIKRINS